MVEDGILGGGGKGYQVVMDGGVLGGGGRGVLGGGRWCLRLRWEGFLRW